MKKIILLAFLLGIIIESNAQCRLNGSATIIQRCAADTAELRIWNDSIGPIQLVDSIGKKYNLKYTGTVGTPKVFGRFIYPNIPNGTYTVLMNGCDAYNSFDQLVTVKSSPKQPIKSVDVTVADSVLTCKVNGGTTSGLTYKWSNGATTKFIVGKPNVTYTVTVTDKYLCTASNSGSFSITTGIKIEHAPEVSIYPNPTNGSFNVKGDNLKVDVYSIEGRLMETKTVNGSESFYIDVPGLYTVRVNDRYAYKIIRQ